MSGDTNVNGPVDTMLVEAQKLATASSINMPDHEVRTARWYQLYVRMARPTLDWATLAWFIWVTLAQPLFQKSFDIAACGMCLGWCATVYGFKFAEKIKGVA